MRHIIPILFFALSLLVSACSGNQQVAATPTAAATINAPTRPAASPSPTAESAKVILLVPGGDPAALPEGTASLRGTLEELAAGAGLKVDVRPALSAADLTPAVKVVVALPSLNGEANTSLAGLASGAPTTQFLAVGIPGVQASSNLSSIGSDPEKQVALLAGYIAAIVTEDWRVGVISLPDAPGQAVRDAFLNGARYLCGICNPKYPPYPGYPAFAEAVSKTDWQAAIDSLKRDGVKTVYVDPALASSDLFDALSKADMQMVGYGPAPELLKPRWVASIQLDATAGLKKIWPEVLAGKGGQSAPMELVLSDVQESLLTVGKMRLVETVAKDIVEGFIQ